MIFISSLCSRILVLELAVSPAQLGNLQEALYDILRLALILLTAATTCT
jgi:hypothetical protein